MNNAAGCYRGWRQNAERWGVPPAVVADIIDTHHISRMSFAVIAKLEQIGDDAGRSYFLIPPGTGVDELSRAVLMTYVWNAGTGYGQPAGGQHDFPVTPYSAAEVQRIKDRQQANRWSYVRARAAVDTGSALVATPNGMLMGLGGNWIQHRLSQRGGTTYGDVFLVNLGRVPDPAQQLRLVVGSGVGWLPGDDGVARRGRLSLGRLLHHEERHAQQWARLGPVRMGAAYLAEEARVRIFGGPNRFEVDAGLRDGGYA